jgi:hypothetical protein
MRRLVPIAAFALFVALPLWAQHGGGHAGGGHGGGFSGGHAGGGHVSGGMHPSPGASQGFGHANFSQRGFSHRGFSNRGFSNRPFRHDGFRHDRFRHDRFRHNRFRTHGFRNQYPWLYGAYYDPYWWWDTGSSYDEDYERDRAIANEMNAQSLEQQRMLREEEARDDQDSYAREPRAVTRDEQKGAAIMPNTVLIFRDQHKQEIGNYAIVGQTLWNFAPQRAEKISLADLDLPATTKANEDLGVTFRVPGSNEAQ